MVDCFFKHFLFPIDLLFWVKAGNHCRHSHSHTELQQSNLTERKKPRFLNLKSFFLNMPYCAATNSINVAFLFMCKKDSSHTSAPSELAAQKTADIRHGQYFGNYTRKFRFPSISLFNLQSVFNAYLRRFRYNRHYSTL